MSAKGLPDEGAVRAGYDDRQTLLAGIVDAGTVGAFLLGPEATIVFANPAFEKMLGHGRGATIGLRADQAVHADDLASLRTKIRGLTGESAGGHSELRCLHKGGRALWVLASASLVRGAEGTTYVAVQVTDIDRHKHAVDDLVMAAARSEYALENSGQGLWDVDYARGTVYHSRNWRIMRGLPPDEDDKLDGEKWLARVHPDDRARVHEANQHYVAGKGKTVAYEYRERHEDGHWIWILSRGRTIEWLPDGSPARDIGTDTDISSVKAVQAELATEKERLSVTLQSIGDGVISTDAQGKVTFMNLAAERMTGWESGEAVGYPVDDVFAIVSEASGESAPSPVKGCLAAKHTYVIDEDVALMGLRGGRRAVRASASPVRTPDGTAIGAVLVFQDTTNARALQKQLAHAALHDSLTGLPNRTAFHDAITAAYDQARNQRREHALCFIDLDRFKLVNDNAGHAAGDALLKRVALAIKGACRPDDFTARVGGDEFVVLLSDCPIAGARLVAQQIIDAISGVDFSWRGEDYEIGASIGITAMVRESPHSAEIMRQADIACYSAKAAGGNHAFVYETGMAGRFAKAI
jgi:diguanylate cyclase (GGDEF)-like protein/PAS domain S-box-containing protein